MPKLSHLHKILDPEVRAKNLRELKYRGRGAYFDITRPQMRDPVFIVGCSRSGTTVTFETISASPEVLSFGYEIPQFWNALHGPHHNEWESEAAGAEHARPEHRQAALRWFYQRLGRGWVVDKTCINVLRIPYLLQLFPDAHFIYIQRDGRDNVSSLMQGWRKQGQFALTQFLGSFPCEVAINGGEFDEWHFFLPPDWRAYNRASLEDVCAYQWSVANRMALDAKRLVRPERWIQLRYEDIFRRPVEMFSEVFERLGLTFDEAMRERCRTLNKRPTSIVSGLPKQEKWRDQNPQAVERIMARIAPLMRELGYEVA